MKDKIKEIINNKKVRLEFWNITDFIKVAFGLGIIYRSIQLYEVGYASPVVTDFPAVATLAIGVMFGIFIMR